MTESKEQIMEEEQSSLLTFPTDFPIKVMGITTPDFREVIGCAVREIVPDFSPETIREEKSKTGKYTSLTVTIHATSRDQLDSLYRMLTSHPSVKIVL